MTCGELVELVYVYSFATVLPAVIAGFLVNIKLKKSYPDIWQRFSTSRKQSNKEFFTAGWDYFLFYACFRYLDLKDTWLNIMCSITLLCELLFVCGWFYLLVSCGFNS